MLQKPMCAPDTSHWCALNWMIRHVRLLAQSEWLTAFKLQSCPRTLTHSLADAGSRARTMVALDNVLCSLSPTPSSRSLSST